MLPGTWAYVSAGAFGRAIIVSFGFPPNVSCYWCVGYFIFRIIWSSNSFMFSFLLFVLFCVFWWEEYQMVIKDEMDDAEKHVDILFGIIS